MLITKEGLEAAKVAYEKDCVPMSEIAGWFGVTRQGLWKAFRREGIETRKRHATRRKLDCDGCGKEYEMTRARYRDNVVNGGTKKHFCSEVCYFAYLENVASLTNRHKQRIARYKVGQVFDLKPEHIVHHKDSDHFNTALENFMVFANHSDHIKYHHQLRQGAVTVVPVWDGAKFKGENKVGESAAKLVIYGDVDLEAANAALKSRPIDKKKAVEKLRSTGFFNPQSKDSQLGKKGAK